MRVHYKHKRRSPEKLRHSKGRWPGRRGRPSCWEEQGGLNPEPSTLNPQPKTERCSATCTRWATARAAAWPIAARVCQKYCPRRNLMAFSLGSSFLCCRNQLVAVGNDAEEPQKLAMEPPAGGHDAGQEGTSYVGSQPFQHKPGTHHSGFPPNLGKIKRKKGIRQKIANLRRDRQEKPRAPHNLRRSGIRLLFP